MRIQALGLAALIGLFAGAVAAEPVSGPGPALTQEKREAAFDFADANHDGQLNRTEFDKTIPTSIANTAEAQFTRRDTNHDGFLSKAEYSVVLAPPGGG